MKKNRVTCIIVDDEPLAIRLMVAHVSRVPELDLLSSFENPLEALAFLRENKVDLVFLDIQMPVLTGMEFARTLGANPAVVFTTAYRDYAVESYELNVLDYLVKPITFPRFYQAINRLLREKLVSSKPSGTGLAKKPDEFAVATDFATLKSEKEKEYRYFNVNKKHVKVELAEITHIESIKDYVRIVTTTQRLVTKEKLGELNASLPQDFLRVHRSFVVNIRHITAFTAHDIEIGDVEIPIGQSYKMRVMERLKA